MKKNLAFIFLITLLILGFSIYKANPTDGKIANINKLENTVKDAVEKKAVFIDYPTSNNLSELKKNADYIVEGVFIKLNNKWNAARNPQDISKESDVNNVEANAYDFKVTKVYKGEIDENILVSLIYSRKMEGMDAPAIDEYFQEPSIGKHVILLLKKDQISGYFYPAIFPYQFEKTNDTKYQVKTNSSSLLKEFTNKEFESNDFAK